MNKISIVIPIYNVEKYLSQCLDSVINQTHPNLEIILVNDGSTDSCGEIGEGYAAKDPRIKVIHKENGGLSVARNA
jgi:glycosyltransferase involved in cell wall biosynthesis